MVSCSKSVEEHNTAWIGKAENYSYFSKTVKKQIVTLFRDKDFLGIDKILKGQNGNIDRN